LLAQLRSLPQSTSLPLLTLTALLLFALPYCVLSVAFFAVCLIFSTFELDVAVVVVIVLMVELCHE